MAASVQELQTPKERWDLSSLFEGMDDPKIEDSWKTAHQRADVFAQRFREKIDDPALTADTLYSAIIDLERLSNDLAKPLSYANLLFAVDAADPKIGAFMQAQMERASDIRVKLMFFELELQAAKETLIDRALEDKRLKPYEHFIRTTRVFSPYRLSEPEEIILEETANTGSRAWVRLFEEITANHVFKLRRPGSEMEEDLTEQEVLDLLRNENRLLRQAASDSLTAGLRELQRVIVFTYNNLLQEKRVEDRLRKHPYPEHSRHLSNELDKETVDLVVGLCKEQQALVARYYRVKKEILGLSELTHIDRYAPLTETKQQVSYDQARVIVLDSFRAFNEEIARRASEFFERKWIDAEPRVGKTGGAFCSYITPDTHPVIMMSYLNKMNDVGTLAHELGHGVHASLSREQTYFNFHGTLPLAELASIFGEQLVFDRLFSSASDQDRLAMVGEKIEQTFASVFRQAAMFRFEQRCHEERRSSGELPPDRFGEIWQEELQSMFGDSVKLGDDHRLWWSYVGHFFFAPFYVYAYSFGELLSLAVYEKSHELGLEFADKYVALLKMGGSRSPEQLMETIGVDLKSRDFWLGGFRAIEQNVIRFEELWTKLSEK